MEIYQLKTLLVVAREQHLTRAAERLHISQPAVSGQIKSIEQELGIAFFQRKHAGMELTKAGAALIPYVEKILAATTSLSVEARRYSGKVVGRLSLGMILNPDFIRLGELTTYLLARHPQLDLDIRHRNSIAVLASLRSQELDASFYLGQKVPEDIESVELRPVAYRVVAAPSWADKFLGADWPAIADLPWITTPREGAFFQMLDGFFRDHGQRVHNVIEADQESAIINLVRAGVGVTLIREEVAIEAHRLGQLLLWPDGKTVSSLRLIFLANRRDDPIIAALLAGVASVWGEQPAAVAPGVS